MSRETVRYEKADGIGVLTFNRPQVLNAHNYQMKTEIQAVAREAAADDEVRVLVLTGAGRGFHAGEDVKEVFLGEDLAQRKAARRSAMIGDRTDSSWNAQINPVYFYGYPKPTIAAVNGPAVGAGLSIALSCDVRIASTTASFGYYYTRRGLMGPARAITMLINLMGASRATEMILAGELVDAEEALRTGLVREVVDAERLLDAAGELARKLMRGAPLAQRAIKQVVFKAMFDPAGIEEFNTLAEEALSDTEDHHEGALAFAERREPKWTSR